MIIVSEKFDVFTSKVEQWLRFYNKKCHRINLEVPISEIELSLTNGFCDIYIKLHDDNKINLTEQIIWHRRGNISFGIDEQQAPLNEKVYSFLSNEASALSNGILLIMKTKNMVIGNHIDDKGNKLYNLFVASKYGLNIPNTFVVNTKVALLEICKENPNLITKPIKDSFFGTIESVNLLGFVEKLEKETLDQLPDLFFPMLFQTEIERAYEVRSFYFCSEIFSMATIVSENEKNIKDIKEVGGKSKRHVPYELPIEIKNSIKAMMNQIDLDTACFDFVIDKKGILYFLELNPFGQLNNMSHNCNYSVEEFVANSLMHNE